MLQYRYTNMDYEEPEPPRNTVYDRILAGVYKKGREAAAGHYSTRPQNPYKRSDFAEAWDIAFDEAYVKEMLAV